MFLGDSWRGALSEWPGRKERRMWSEKGKKALGSRQVFEWKFYRVKLIKLLKVRS